jgi:phosphocarrier protein
VAAEEGESAARRTVVICNRLGMHARAAVSFVQLASTFKSTEITVAKDGEAVNGKSIMGLLTLVAAWGVSLEVRAVGAEAKAAVAALGDLVERGFNEGVETSPGSRT